MGDRIIYEISAQLIGALAAVITIAVGATKWIHNFKSSVERDIEELEEELEEDVEKNTNELREINKQLETINVGLLALMENNKYINADKFRNALRRNGYEPEDFFNKIESNEDA